MFKIGVILMALSTLSFSNWFTDLFDSTPTPTIHIPVDLTKAGTLVETEFRVNYKESTYFALDFECKDVKDCNEERKFLGFNGYLYGDGKKITVADYARAKRYLGDLIDESYNVDGTIVPLQITLHKIEENGRLIMVLDKTYNTKGYNAENGARHITVKYLKKGKYKLIVKNLQAFEELNGRPVKFKIKSTYSK